MIKSVDYTNVLRYSRFTRRRRGADMYEFNSGNLERLNEVGSIIIVLAHWTQLFTLNYTEFVSALARGIIIFDSRGSE